MEPWSVGSGVENNHCEISEMSQNNNKYNGAELLSRLTDEIKCIFFSSSSYPRVPRPAMGGLGGFCVGGLVLASVPPRPAALFPCC